MVSENFDLSRDAITKLNAMLDKEGVALGPNEEWDEVISNDLLVKMLETPVEFYVLKTGELAVTIDGEEHVLDPKTDSIVSGKSSSN